MPEAVVDAVAARNPQRARVCARQYDIPRVQESYAALVADPALDAVYIATPNSPRCEWAIRALEAGKHILCELCEKPFAANTAQAERMATIAARTGRLLMEAFHYRYHPLTQRMQAIRRCGELGRITHIEVWMNIPILNPRDIRYRYDVAGGPRWTPGATRSTCCASSPARSRR